MNPFSPNFGTVPPIFLDRQKQVNQLVDELQNPLSPFRTTIVYGTRGSGKTSFITDVSNKIEAQSDWLIVNLALGSNLMPTLVDSIYQKAAPPLKKALNALDGLKFSAFGIELDFSQKTPTNHQYQVVLENILQKLREKNVKLLITIDEVKSTPEVRQLMSIYQILLRENFQISLIMTGLPNHVSELQNDDVLTFLLRSGRIVLTPLDRWSILNSYQKTFQARQIDPDALRLLTRLTAGYAYAFQLLGYLVWQNCPAPIKKYDIQAVLPQYQTELSRNAYLKIYQGLSTMDQQFLMAMAEASTMPVSTNEIGQKLQKSKNYLSVYRRRLLDAQVVYSPQRGQLSFSLPLFKDFLLDYAAFED